MNVYQLKDKKDWNNFILANKGEFLQSYLWGSFKQKLGEEALFFGLKDREQKISQALVIKRKLALGKKYFYCPRGPVFIPSLTNDKKIQAVKTFLAKLKDLAQEKQILFFRFEPGLGLKDINLSEIFSNLRINYQRIDSVQPKETLILDLNKKEDDLLKSMRQKTRYNIRLARRHGVKIFNSTKIDIFFQLLKEVAKRQKIKIYSKKYYLNLVKEFKSLAKIYFAYYRGKALAASLILFWNKSAIYLYGGSTRENRQVMPSYFLHWQIIKEAKSQNFLKYDFWGIDEKKWPGLTRFKLGFGGERLIYPQAYDLIFDKSWYFLYKMGSKFRRGLTLHL